VFFFSMLHSVLDFIHCRFLLFFHKPSYPVNALFYLRQLITKYYMLQHIDPVLQVVSAIVKM
jgi:hypothetical protein